MLRIQTFFIVALMFVWVGGTHPACCQNDSVNDDYGMAAGHYERQEYESAIAKFREVIKNYPSTRQAAISYFFLGESLVQLQDYQAAFPAYQIFLERLPRDKFVSRAEFRIAECAYRLDWSSQATTAFENFAKKFPEHELNEYALPYLGELRLERDEPQLALRVFDRALNEFPRSANVSRNRFGQAKALQALQRHDEAIQIFQLLTADPTNALAGQSKLQIGIIEFENANVVDAKKTIQLAAEWLNGNERLPEAQYWLAKCEMQLDEFESALDRFKAVIESAKSQDLKMAVLFEGALAAAKADDVPTALAWLNRLQMTWPESQLADDALQLKIELLFKEKMYDEALISIGTFENEYSENANLPVALQYKCQILYEREQFAESVNLLTSFDSRFPEIDTQRRHRWIYLKALGQIGLNDFAAASATLSRLNEPFSDDQMKSAVLLAKASCAVGMDKSEQAISLFEQYLSITTGASTSTDRAFSDLINAYTKKGDWGKVETAIVEFEARNFEPVSLLETELLVAERALKEKRFDLAERSFRSLAETPNPRKFVVRGLSGIAWVQVSRGDQANSIQMFEELISEHSESPFAAEAAMVCGKYFEQQNQYQKAIELYRQIQNRFGESKFAAQTDVRIAACLASTGIESDRLEAETILQRFLNRQSNNNDEAQYRLAWLYLGSGRKSMAYELFDKVAKQPDSPFWSDATYRVAKEQLENKNYAEAQQMLAELRTREHPENIKTRIDFLAGQIAIHQKNWGQVAEQMSVVLKEADESEIRVKSRYWLAEALFHTKQYDPAIIEYSKLIDNVEQVSSTRRAWSALRQSQCQAHLQNWTLALESATDGKKRFPEFEARYKFDFIIGRSHAAKGRLTEARNAFKKVIESDSGKSTETAAMAQWRIGECYFHQNNFERAIESFYKVDSLYTYEKWRAAALVEAGKCQEHLGNWNHAVKLYQQLVDKFPDSEFRVAAEHRISVATRQAQRTTSNHKK